MILVVGSILFLVAVVVGIVQAILLPRRYEIRVRDWARENGYAILTIKRQGRFFDYVFLFLFGWLGLIIGLGPYGFRLLIQDDQGGQTNVTVFVSKPGEPVDVRWG